MKNDRKITTYFETSVKNQIAQLKKDFKENQENLEIISGGFFNKNVI